MKHAEWNPISEIPDSLMPILISFEDCRYPEIGYYDDFDGKFYVEREDITVLSDGVSLDDIVASKIGKVNGWMPLPTCKDYKEGR